MSEDRLIEPKLKKRKKYGNRSEYSKTIKTDKGYTNVPSMYGGQEYDEDFLTELYKDNKTDPETGRRVKTFKTIEEATVAAKRRSSRLKKGGFNPEGSGYDYKRAKELDYKRDDKGHLPTRDYKTGMILKGKKHETFSKGVQEDFKKGYQLKKKGDRYYTIKSKREFNKLREKASLPHVSQSLKVGGLKKSGFKIEMPEPSPEYKKIQEQRQKYDIDCDLIDREKYDYDTLLSDPAQYKKRGKKNKLDKLFYRESPIMKKFYKGLEKRQEKNPFGRKTGGMSGCPHRENGVKSDIKGISDIQVKGKKFIGVK